MSRDSSKTFYEFFAGGGMARLGLGSDWQCLFANDFDPVKAAAYRDNFSDAASHFQEGDVWNISASDLPGQADVAWASSPCQDFSLAGARAGLEGGRSSAFFGFWKLVEALGEQGRAPRVVVIENVVGLLTSHGGRDFEALCRALSEQGYTFGALEIDAARFLPQSRPRVFVVATLAKPPKSSTAIEPTLPFHSKRVEASYKLLPADLRAHWHWWQLRYPPASNEDVSTKLDDDREVNWLPPEKTTKLLSLLGPLHQEKLSRAKERRERVIGTLFRRMRVEGKKKVQRAELRFDGFAGCLRTPSGGSSRQFVVCVEGEQVRARPLTPREGARLMGLPEDYRLPKATTSALKIIGDGVAVPVVEFLRENLLSELIRGEIENGERPKRKLANAR